MSISLEVLWRQSASIAQEGSVVGFMAGGDLALVHSIEKFEDHPEYGARQLLDLGFSSNDLLISTTEGGETPFVIGATEEAARVSSRRPWFLYCNPDTILCEIVERSRRVLENPGIEKICLSVGPMAISGSTRMQASTVLMLGVGMAMFQEWDGIERLSRALQNADLSQMVPLITEESRIYREGGFTSYSAARHGITILTDTTERAPTFSLRSFENVQDEGREGFGLSLVYFHLPGTQTPAEAWRALLGRDPRPVEWPAVAAVAGGQRLMGFDFSDPGARSRVDRVARRAGPQPAFLVERSGEALLLQLLDQRAVFPVPGLSLLQEHLLLKLILNMHSAVVMGRLGRFESNLMTYVRPSNMKLIDRTIRYVQQLLGASQPGYPAVARAVFTEMESLLPDEPIVLRVVAALRAAS